MHWRTNSRRPRIVLAVLVVAVVVPVCVIWSESRRDIVDFVRQAPPMRVKVEARESNARGVETSDLVLQDDDGMVHASLRLPAGDGPFPALVILGGMRTGRHAIDLVRDDLELAVAALDYANDTRSLDGLGLVAALPELVRDSRRTAVALRDLARFVAGNPRVDASRVYLLGASLGTPFACVTAASDACAGLVLLYGFADHPVLFEHVLRPHVRWQPARTLLAQMGGALTRGFDARRTLPRACGTPVLFITSPEDTRLPRRSTEALWSAACEPRQRVDLPGGHIDAARNSEILQQSTAIILAWIEEHGAKRACEPHELLLASPHSAGS